MSSDAKDPLEKQDTSSDTSESSHSESEIDGAEDNMHNLKLADKDKRSKEATKDDTDESKPLDSPNQEGTLISNDPLNEPIAGPSGLQGPYLESSDESLDQGSKVASLTDPEQGKKVVTKGIDENIGAKMMAEEPHTTSITPPLVQSSTGVTPPSMLEGASSLAGPSVFRGELDNLKRPIKDVYARFMEQYPHLSSSSKRYNYATDSANTSADVSEIRSEIADSSAEGSVYHDASESFEKEESPSYASAVERQISESSDTNISEIQDFVPPPTPESSSVSISTNTGEQGHQAYLAQLQREAEARGEEISTSSGIGSTNQSELGHLQDWNLAGEMGFYRHNVDDPSQDIADNVAAGGEPLPTSESMEDEPALGAQQMQNFDALFEQDQQNEENMDEMNAPETSRARASASRLQVKSDRVSSIEACSPSKRMASKCQSDSSESEKGATGQPRQRKPEPGKKSKMVTRKSCPATQSSSESPEPKTSSSEELQRKESPEIKSASEGQEVPKSETGRKEYQKSGQLRRFQQSTISSNDSVIDEEEVPTSPFGEKDPTLMETKESTPEKMETSPEKGDEGASEVTEHSEAKPSTVSSDQAYGSETERTLKEDEETFDDLEFDRSVGKSKRHPKLSSSPPSDEKPDESPQKAATNRPKKKPRSEKMPGKQRRTRHGSGGTVPKTVGLGNLQQSESTSTPDVSDYTPSDDEKAS